MSLIETGWRADIFMKGMGSFRGAKFYVAKTSSGVGRRTVVHEFPGSDDAAVDDLGKKVRRYRLEAYVLGDNYMTARDLLVTQLETPGPGILVHPFWGTKTVTVDGAVEIEEDFREGGMARFTLNVVEAGLLENPVEGVDFVSQIDDEASGMLAAAESAFADAMSVADAIGDTIAAVVNTVNEVTAELNSIKGDITAVMNTIDTIGDAISSFADTVTALIKLPGQLASELSSLVTSVMDSIGNIGTAWDSYFASGEGPSSTGATPSQAPSAASPASSDMRAAYLLATGQRLIGLMDGLPAVTGSTIMQLAKAANQRALMMLVKSCVTLATAKVAVRIPYASSDSATSMRAALVDMLDACVELTDDDAAYAAIVRLRSTVVEHLTGVATNLPKIVTYTPAETTPALVIAQQLYGSSALAQDLIDRNDIENPACVAGGVELEVLSA